MIVLDTTVVSEAMGSQPDPAVSAWLNERVAETLFLSSVTVAELACGIAALPAGRRRRAIGARAPRRRHADRVVQRRRRIVRRGERAQVPDLMAPDGVAAVIADEVVTGAGRTGASRRWVRPGASAR